jgi:hypothetical protein
LNKEGKKFDRNSSIPTILTFDKQYLQDFQVTLKDLAGSVVKT